MKRGVRIAAFVLALAVLALSVFNASWRADPPRGSPTLVAYRGVAQIADVARSGEEGCAEARIEPPLHTYIDNTVRSAQQAYRLGARMVEIDLRVTADGAFVLFHDDDIGCRTDGSGPIGDKTLAELKALDVGHGFTADGRAFPLRGAVGQIPTLRQMIVGSEGLALWFDMKRVPADAAPGLVAAIAETGRDPVAEGDAFFGDDANLAAIRERWPDAWTMTSEGVIACTDNYKLTGWTGSMPEACRGGTMVIPTDGQFFFWGWPNLLIERMGAVGGRIVVSGPDGGPAQGLFLPEQLGDVPATFNGHILVGDIWTVGPALYPRRDPRGAQQTIDARAALERRREATGN